MGKEVRIDFNEEEEHASDRNFYDKKSSSSSDNENDQNLPISNNRRNTNFIGQKQN